MTEVVAVYLARAQNGLKPLRAFLESYARFPSGIRHDLLIVFKGFSSEQETAEYEKEASPFAPKKLFMRDFGFDIRAYGLAVGHFDYPFFCFLNSFSEILEEGWLTKMYAFVSKKDVGLVGATGSYESMYSNALFERGQQLDASTFARVRNTIRVQLCRLCFDPFPNYHIRTNAFMMSRELVRAVWPNHVLTKRGAYLFENGKRSLTKRILRMNLKALVVGRDGQAYDREDWPKSNTFRQVNQSNLLVADNQTRQYANADSETRALLARLAWGNWGKPAQK